MKLSVSPVKNKPIRPLHTQHCTMSAGRTHSIHQLLADWQYSGGGGGG